MAQSAALCLILIPFGKKKDATGREVDFDAVYHRLVVPAVQSVGLQPVRSDEQGTDGMIHKSWLERLLICEYAVADLTGANACVCYGLGIRHAAQPRSTVLLMAAGSAQLPFDLDQLQVMPYRVSPQGLPVNEAKYRSELAQRLKAGREPVPDSPVYRLLEGYPRLEPARCQAVGDDLQRTLTLRKRLADARGKGGHAVREVEALLGAFDSAEPSLVIDLFLSYLAVRWWNEMIELVARMPAPVANTVVVREQLALALNWAGRGEEAEKQLRDLIARRGPSSESYGKLGGILKHRWERALDRGEPLHAKEMLDKAAGAYLKGFEADWRDTYCGLNAVILMELKASADPRRRSILPVVHYAVEQRIRSGAADYWDYATQLELAVLSCDEAKGLQALAQTLGRVREAWEPETTARSLRLVREARVLRGADCPVWADRAEQELLKAAAPWTAKP